MQCTKNLFRLSFADRLIFDVSREQYCHGNYAGGEQKRFACVSFFHGRDVVFINGKTLSIAVTTGDFILCNGFHFEIVSLSGIVLKGICFTGFY